MPIKLHCDHCGKKIEAPDSAGGRWGKCPACHNKVYVPAPPSGDDELKLAPLDEGETDKQQQLLAETYELTHAIFEENNPSEGPPTSAGTGSEIREETLTEYIVQYLRQMANGDLDEAQRTADRIVPHRRQAARILDAMAKSDAPDPALKDVPGQVLSGLIRNLRTRIS
jgi:hypothetical protein